MSPVLRIVAVAVVAALGVAAVASSADARFKKPGEPVAKKCYVEGETMESGSTMDVLEQTSKGVLVRSYTCVNGRVCLKAYDEKGNRINGAGDCWMSPASQQLDPSGGAVAPGPYIVKRR